MNSSIHLSLLCLFCMGSAHLSAQLDLPASGTSATVDFTNTISGVNNGTYDALNAPSASPGIGDLDSDAWSFAGFNTAADLSRGVDADGGVSTGGVYAFTTSSGTNTLLGVQPASSDFTPGSITLTVTNNTGGELTAFNLAFSRWVNNDQNRSNSLDVSVSSDGSSFSGVASMAYNSPGTSDMAGFQSTAVSGTITLPSSVNDGGDFFIRWEGSDNTGSGARDEFGIDDIQISNPVLPLQLLSFVGDVLDTEIVLKWETAAEVNIDHFIIEKSDNDGKSYVIIGREVSQGFSMENTRYHFVDRAQSASSSLIYRLSVVELDGTITVEALITLSEREKPNWSFYPTLTKDRITIATSEPQVIEMVSLDGQIVKSLLVEGQTEVDLVMLPAGVYLLRGFSGSPLPEPRLLIKL